MPLISLQVADLTCTEETIMVMNFPGEPSLHGAVCKERGDSEEVAARRRNVSKGGVERIVALILLRPGYEQTRMHYLPSRRPWKARTPD
jgi:hypothetical protein